MTGSLGEREYDELMTLCNMAIAAIRESDARVAAIKDWLWTWRQHP